MELNDKIKNLRINKRWIQKELAEKLHISEDAVSS